MKKIFLLGLVIAGMQVTSTAQYTDDIYYRSSDAARDAKNEAKNNQNNNVATYSSSGYDNYDDNYQGQYDESYIDYDDDSYATRIRRFYHPIQSVGYYGGIYSPYWMSPFYTNPYYGWGGFCRPGFSITVGMGPYWSSAWNHYHWYGYTNPYGYSPWGYSAWGYNPYSYYGYGGYGFGGFGYGYGGYWNGYYAGLNDGRYFNRNRTSYNYSPRGNNNIGNYRSDRGVRPINNRGGLVLPERVGNTGNAIANPNRNRGVSMNGAVDNNARAQRSNDINANSRNQRVIDNNTRVENNRLNNNRVQNGQAEINRNNQLQQRQQMQQRQDMQQRQQMQQRQNNNFNRMPNNATPSRPQMNSNPGRMQQSMPSAPSRSTPSMSPSRGGGSFNGGGSMGGGSRGGGSRR